MQSPTHPGWQIPTLSQAGLHLSAAGKWGSGSSGGVAMGRMDQTRPQGLWWPLCCCLVAALGSRT